MSSIAFRRQGWRQPRSDLQPFERSELRMKRAEMSAATTALVASDPRIPHRNRAEGREAFPLGKSSSPTGIESRACGGEVWRKDE